MTRSGGPQVLLAGTLHDVPAIRMVLDNSVQCVYGQIYLEVDAAQADLALGLLPADLPPGMSLTLLQREPGTRPGGLLARALTAWAGEWATDDAAPAAVIAMWVGCSGNPLVDAACDSLAARLDRTPVHLHRD